MNTSVACNDKDQAKCLCLPHTVGTTVNGPF